MDSILTSVKKALGIVEDYTHFDDDLIMHINTVFFLLMQIGVGPDKVFAIKDKEAKWVDFISEDNNNFEPIKTYTELKVKLIFDPPGGSSTVELMKTLISELEWRMNVEAQQEKHRRE